jgi:hypothetical protein
MVCTGDCDEDLRGHECVRRYFFFLFQKILSGGVYSEKKKLKF